MKEELEAPRLDRTDALAVLAAFALSRLVYAAMGVRFDASTLDWYWQFIDPVLLRGDLLASVWRLHAQPPLFNLFLGAVLHLPRGVQASVFAGAFAALGCATAIAMVALQRGLGVRRPLRVAIALGFVVTPASVLYENQLFTTLPVIFLLSAGALALLEGLRGPRPRRWPLAVGFLLFAGVTLTHSLFHPLWLVALVAVTALVAPRGRPVLMAALPALLLAGAWSVRGWAMYGLASNSSWAGMSWAQMQLRLEDPSSVRALAAADPACAILAVPAFSPLADYAAIVASPPPTGRPILDRPFKSSGAPNVHHLGYVAIAQRYGVAARWLVTQRPQLWRSAIGAAWRLYFRSAADSAWLGANRERVEPVERVVRFLSGQRWRFRGRVEGGAVAWLWVAGFAAALGSAGIAARRSGRVAAAVVLGMAITVSCVALVGNAVELGENNRFRFMTEPYLWVLLGLAAEFGRRRMERARSGL
jgi:hypothetical protein